MENKQDVGIAETKVYKLDYYFITTSNGVTTRSDWYSDTLFGFDFNHAANKLIRKHTSRADEIAISVPLGNNSDYVTLWQTYREDNNTTLYIADEGEENYVYYV